MLQSPPSRGFAFSWRSSGYFCHALAESEGDVSIRETRANRGSSRHFLDAPALLTGNAPESGLDSARLRRVVAQASAASVRRIAAPSEAVAPDITIVGKEFAE